MRKAIQHDTTQGGAVVIRGVFPSHRRQLSSAPQTGAVPTVLIPFLGRVGDPQDRLRLSDARVEAIIARTKQMPSARLLGEASVNIGLARLAEAHGIAGKSSQVGVVLEAMLLLCRVLDEAGFQMPATGGAA